MKLQNLIRVYDDVIDAENCNQIIRAFEEHKDQAKLHATPGYKFLQLDLNETEELVGLAHAYVNHLLPFIEDYFKSLGFDSYVHPRAGFENVRIKRYTKGDDFEFKPHIDAANRETAIRYLVFILYLNDNNGFTGFPGLNYEFKPKQGSVIMFPPHWMFPHYGASPTDHDKYIMMSCLHHT